MSTRISSMSRIGTTMIGAPSIGTRDLATSARWLLLLRWVAVIGQLATIGFVRYGLGVELPMVPLVSVIGITAVSNLAFAFWVRWLPTATHSTSTTRRPVGLAPVMGLDLLLLTTLLYFAGGAANPFSIFYLVNLTLCAVVLSERWGWLLTVGASIGMCFLLVRHVTIPGLSSTLQIGLPWLASVTLEQVGRIVATVACALVIIHFVSRVTRQLEVAAHELQRMERDRSRSDKLEALGTLAGGAAHELSTPLSTIAVIANEMVRNLQDVAVPDSVREDALLIRSQVDHCRGILQRMTGRAGQWMAEQYVELSVDQLVRTTVDELVEKSRVDLVLPAGAAAIQLRVPTESTAQALRGLLQNALDVTPDGGKVQLIAEWNSKHVRLSVRDRGPGMSKDVLDRAGEPFFTTKEPGRGMGLGLFLTRSVVERLGGRLVLDSSEKGVTATVVIPREKRFPS